MWPPLPARFALSFVSGSFSAVVAGLHRLPSSATRSLTATGSSQWGQAAVAGEADRRPWASPRALVPPRPVPTRRQKRPRSGQGCSPRYRVPHDGHSYTVAHRPDRAASPVGAAGWVLAWPAGAAGHRHAIVTRRGIGVRSGRSGHCWPPCRWRWASVRWNRCDSVPASMISKTPPQYREFMRHRGLGISQWASWGRSQEGPPPRRISVAPSGYPSVRRSPALRPSVWPDGC